MIYRNLFIALFLIFTPLLKVEAQEGIPVYFDYLTDNDYLIHPSMAGHGNGGKIRITGRQQWFDVNDAPNLQTLNFQFRVPDSPSGIGFILFKDENGYHGQSGAKLTYAHHLNFAEDSRFFNQLSFGLSATTLQISFDQRNFINLNNDPLVSGSFLSSFYFNVDLGMSYAYREWYVHATILNFLESERNLYTNTPSNLGVPVIDNLRRYIFSLGYRINKGDWWMEPSLMIQISDFSKDKTLDLNGKVYKNIESAVIWGGFSVRGSLDRYTSKEDEFSQRLVLITPIFGVNYKRYLISYNYSQQIGDTMGNWGFHQITLGLDFGPVREDRFNPKWRIAPITSSDFSN